MGMIYLAQPRGNRIRSIDKLKPKDRKKPANCNNSNIKFGKHLSNFSDLKDRYERLVGDVDVKVIVNIPDSQIQEFESVLKRVFAKYIKKFQEEYAPIEHEVVSHQDLEKDNCNDYMFDIIIGWSQEMENPFVGPDFYLDRLNTNGILIIQNSSDSIFLYQNDTVASPTASYHEEIKLRKDCRMYHVPLFFGLTIVVKQ